MVYKEDLKILSCRVYGKDVIFCLNKDNVVNYWVILVCLF